MTMGLRRIAAILGCALALQFAASCAPATKRLPTPVAGSPVKVHAGPAMWRVADKDTTIYLFGTIHFLPAEVDWFDEEIRRALQSSDELVTELDPQEDNRLAELMEEVTYLPEGENLRDRLGVEERKAFEEYLVSQGIPVDQFDRFKPWSAALFLSVLMTLNAGFDPDQGVETVIENNAPAGITHTALETFDFQIQLFNTLPEEQQVAYLSQVIASAPTLKQDLDSMLDDWLAGDAEALAALMNAEETDPLLYSRILTDRNADWAKWIDARLDRPGTVFVAVGAGHLAGKGSLQDKLRKLGIRSRRVH